jgi:hypothetical protein
MSSTLFGGVLAGAVVLWIVGKLFRRWAVSRFTVMSDLPTLGTPRLDGQKLGQTVIICGGRFVSSLVARKDLCADAFSHSVAGLLAARVCTDHYARVLVIDPDATRLVTAARAPDAAQQPPPHSRVMQYELFHAVQALFVHGLLKLFPGTFEREIAAAGVVIGSGNFNPAIGGVLLRAPFEQLPEPAKKAIGMTRAAYETILRRIVAMDKRIEFIDGMVLAFDVDASNAKMLAGVRYRPTSDVKAVLSLKGDLIIGSLPTLLVRALLNIAADCTGAAHSGLTLLQRASPAFTLPKDAIESYQPKMRYTSCIFDNALATLAPYFQQAEGYDTNAPILAFFIPVASMETRWLGFARVEGDRRESAFSFSLLSHNWHLCSDRARRWTWVQRHDRVGQWSASSCAGHPGP